MCNRRFLRDRFSVSLQICEMTTTRVLGVKIAI